MRWTEHTHPAPSRPATTAGSPVEADDRGKPSVNPQGALSGSYFASGSFGLLNGAETSAVSVRGVEAASVSDDTFVGTDDSSVGSDPQEPVESEDRKLWWKEHRARAGLLAGVVLLVAASGVTGRSADPRSDALFCAANAALENAVDVAADIEDSDSNGQEAARRQGEAAVNAMAATAPSSVADDVIAVRDFDAESAHLPELDGDMMADDLDEWRSETDQAFDAMDEFQAAQTRVRTYIEQNCVNPE